MKLVHKLERCRAIDQYKEKAPLTAHEYDRLLEMAVDCPLTGMPFDKASFLYPLFIPPSPQIRILCEDPEVISVSLRFNFSQFIGLVGNRDLKETVLAHPGAVLFAAGNIIKKEKGTHTYLNLRPRGWLIVEDYEYRESVTENITKHKKKSLSNTE